MLTTREAAVFAARLRGLTVKEVAVELRISYHTVRHHLERIHQKVGVHSLQQAVCAFQSDRCRKCRMGFFARYTSKMKVG